MTFGLDEDMIFGLDVMRNEMRCRRSQPSDLVYFSVNYSVLGWDTRGSETDPPSVVSSTISLDLRLHRIVSLFLFFCELTILTINFPVAGFCDVHGFLTCL